jgi:hypothetical protein
MSAANGREQGSLAHAILNFWGLILAAMITVVGGIWINSNRQQFEAERARLEQQFREQKTQLEEQSRIIQARSSPMPQKSSTEADLEKKKLNKDLEAARTQAKASDDRTAELQAKLTALEQRIAELRAAQNEPTAVPQVTSAPPSPANKAGNSPGPRQKLERFIAEVTRAQVHGENATLYVRFTSTTTSITKMLLADGFLGANKTFLVDDSGQRFDLDNSSGIGNCCFGFAGGDWHGAVLELGPKATADITLTFRRRNRSGELERHPQTFTLTAELTMGDVVKRQDWPTSQWQSSGSFGLAIPDITPR